MAKEIICGIYCIFNKVNHKRYVGQSVDIFERWGQHRRSLTKKTYSGDNKHITSAWHKYGEKNFEFFIIEQCTEAQLDDYETYWIDYYDSTDSTKGYNKTRGGKYDYRIIWSEKDKALLQTRFGESHPQHILSERDVRQIIKRFENGDSTISIAKDYNVTKKTISNIRRHRSWTYLTKGRNFKQSSYWDNREMKSNKAQAVDMYTLDGVLVKTFSSINKAAEEFKCKNSSISNVCHGKCLSLSGYIFRFHGSDFNSLRVERKPARELVPVDQYDLNWNYIQSFNSIKEARINTGINTISNSLLNPVNVGGGYHWLRKGELPPEDKTDYRFQNNWTAVDQYDSNWNLINSYDSIVQAVKVTGIKQVNISSVLSGRQNYAGGFHWLRHGEIPPKDNSRENIRYKSVDQYDKDWNYIATYSMIKQASDITGANESTIHAVLKGKYKTAGGYRWLHHGEQPPIKNE